MRDVVSAGRYCFVLMPFGELWGVYESAIRPAIEASGMKALRADDVPGAGYDLLEKIHTLITHASVLVAEVSRANPNVTYELGFARGIGKPTILISQNIDSMPTDLRGLAMIPYEETREGNEGLKTLLERTLRSCISSNIALLRDMLEPPTPGPCYILAQPKPPAPQVVARLADAERMRTYGDSIGIIGLIRSFGFLFGERLVPELVDALAASPRLSSEPNNLFLIGGPTVNKWTDELLRNFQNGRPPNWSFGPRAGDQVEGGRKRKTVLQGILGNRSWVWPEATDTSVASTDYGIIVRGPHPGSREKMVTIMAGLRSIGTGAACLAATTSTLIETIQQKLPVSLADKSRTVWVLVRGDSEGADRHISPEGVTVVDAGVYEDDG